MKVRVLVRLKNGVLDPQGKAVEHSLHALGFAEARDVRIGRVVEFAVPDGPDAPARIEAMCRQLLANPVIEQFHIEREP
ncbi:MAG: phosphoribosylformylglycinamidine synthase subunit PurS [Deltaproteobacteria bacterium]|nr:phosphoribosylformylglycinamidine synthase subunit PurS [Deltaproteobacteria bacterium]